MPTASLDLTGIASYELFLRGTLDKIGAYPDALHIGDYKTASNTFTEHTFTPAHREMAESLNRDLYEQLVRGIADGRKKSETDVRALIDHGPFLPEDALRAGLSTTSPTRTSSTTRSQLGAREARHFVEQSDYRHVSADLARPEPRAADRRHLRQRASSAPARAATTRRRGRSSAPTRSSSTCARRAPTARSRRSCCASTAPAARRSPPT